MKPNELLVPPNSVHIAVQDTLDEILKIMRNGLFDFTFQETVPTDTPDGYEARLVKTGGNFYVYFYFKADAVWKRVQVT